MHYLKAKLNIRIFKFIGVGILNTLFGYSIYAGFVIAGLSPLVALLMATIVGVVFNYFSFGGIVFKSLGGWRMFSKFILAYAIVYAINATLLSVLTEGVKLNEFLIKQIVDLTHDTYLPDLLTKGLKINAYFAQGICVFPSVILSWFLMNLWVYK